MEQITIEVAQRLSSPNPFCVVTAIKENGTTNLTAASWWTYVSNRPPTLCVCLGQKGYTNELIHTDQQFSVCLIDDSIASQAMLCGKCSGRTVNKAENFGIELMNAKTINAAVVKKSKVVFECKLVQVVKVSDHDLFIGEISAIYADQFAEHVYSLSGYGAVGAFER